jgi:capsular polysaccharide biosynthesis protein
VAFDRWLRLLPGSFLNVKRIKRDQKKIAVGSFFLKKKRRLHEHTTYALVHDHWFGGYYHWLIETLPRLCKIYHSNTAFTLLLPARVKTIPFITESLIFFPDLKIEYLQQDEIVFVQDLLLPSHLPGDGLIEPELLCALKENCKSEGYSQKRRIYITRRKAIKRKVVNEEAVVSYLRQYGFEEVALEELHFCEQINLFRSAEVVVSMHGAGLANIIFMEPASIVIEIPEKATGG